MRVRAYIQIPTLTPPSFLPSPSLSQYNPDFLTITDSEAKVMAETIYGAMWGKQGPYTPSTLLRCRHPLSSVLLLQGVSICKLLTFLLTHAPDSLANCSQGLCGYLTQCRLLTPSCDSPIFNSMLGEYTGVHRTGYIRMYYYLRVLEVCTYMELWYVYKSDYEES